ncbi:MAG: sterol desaturase family protein [Bacteroidota bacterium]|jgi:sterol desaturase/sphingolipid hydroxylase (fatty acid hydroxylase superfamily)
MTQEDIQTLVLSATPLYAIVIGIEMIMSYVHNRHYYTTKDTLTNVYLSTLNFLLDVLMKGMVLVVLGGLYEYRWFQIDQVWLYWIMLLLLEDFAFYWEHRIDHYCRFFWAVHVTHHSSDKFNLTTGFRSSVFQPLYRFVYFIPLALMGFKTWDIMFMYAATQIYGILIHTEYVNKLGFLEYILATPSHHRVHHASNIKYLDKNMGMVFIFWDKLFGTFEPEDNREEPIAYGLTKKLDHPHHPVNIVVHEWKAIYKDLKRPLPLFTRLKYVFMPPGWSHDGSSKTSRQLQEEYQRNRSGLAG